MLRKYCEHQVTDAFNTLVAHVNGGGTVDFDDLPKDALTDVFLTSLKRMVGRVEKRVLDDVEYYSDEDQLEITVAHFITYCTGETSVPDDLKNFLDLAEFVCGYYREELGMETRYRIERFAHICRQRDARLTAMAGSNVAQWMERVIF